ncbi:hypothetical protein [Nocardia sp. NPDC058666]|uniref:hypothetical protein n=1 Tax=Nocardia sp. NPDC058666 TaxID=3346587 RepID=UPI003657DDAD
MATTEMVAAALSGNPTQLKPIVDVDAGADLDGEGYRVPVEGQVPNPGSQAGKPENKPSTPTPQPAPQTVVPSSPAQLPGPGVPPPPVPEQPASQPADNQVVDRIDPELVASVPMLATMYNPDGTLKSNEQLSAERAAADTAGLAAVLATSSTAIPAVATPAADPSLSIITRMISAQASEGTGVVDPNRSSAGPVNPVLSMISIQADSTVQPRPTSPFGGSSTVMSALTVWPDPVADRYTGYPSGTGTVASGPYEQTQALYDVARTANTGALVTGGAAAVTTGAVMASTLAITETGILVTAGTMVAVVSWPAVLAVVAGMGAVAATTWILSLDPPEGEEASKGAQPGAVPQPPPAPKPTDLEIPGPELAPDNPQFPLTVDPEPYSPTPTPAPAPHSATPWDPRLPPALDPFDIESDGIEDQTSVPDPTRIVPERPAREPAGPVAPIPLHAADQTDVNTDPEGATGDVESGVDGFGGASAESPDKTADADVSNESAGLSRGTLVDTLAHIQVDPVRPMPRFDPSPYIRAAIASATDDELAAVLDLIERWGEDAKFLLAQYGLKGGKNVPDFAGTDNVVDKLHESLNNLDEVRSRGYPYLFESKRQFEDLKAEVLELARRYGVDPADVIFRVQGGSVHNPGTSDVDVALIVDSKTFHKYARQFLDASMIDKIKRAIKKDEQKGKFSHYRWAPRMNLERPVGDILHDTLPGSYKIQVSLVEEGGPFDFGPYL